MCSVHLKVFVRLKNGGSSSKQQQESHENPTKGIAYVHQLPDNLQVGNSPLQMSLTHSAGSNLHTVQEDPAKQQRPGHRCENFLKEEEVMSPLK